MYLDEVNEAFEQIIELTHDDVDIMGQTFSALYILESNAYARESAFDEWVEDNYDVEWDGDLEEHIYTPK